MGQSKQGKEGRGEQTDIWAAVADGQADLEVRGQSLEGQAQVAAARARVGHGIGLDEGFVARKVCVVPADAWAGAGKVGRASWAIELHGRPVPYMSARNSLMKIPLARSSMFRHSVVGRLKYSACGAGVGGGG